MNCDNEHLNNFLTELSSTCSIGIVSVQLINDQFYGVFESRQRWFGRKVTGCCSLRDLDVVIKEVDRSHSILVHERLNNSIVVCTHDLLSKEHDTPLYIFDAKYGVTLFVKPAWCYREWLDNVNEQLNEYFEINEEHKIEQRLHKLY